MKANGICKVQMLVQTEKVEMKLESLGYSMGDAWSVTNAYTVDSGVSVVGGAAAGAG
jgi:hypothetical protein